NLIVIGRDRADVRAAAADARLILIDVLERKIEREFSVAELQGVKINGTGRRSATRASNVRTE
ncbi:MAG: hypothetical protein JO088_23470, partial [Acidobacteria bacterium]|nr:hypothetical protein [Acidobacteriota bacterium]